MNDESKWEYGVSEVLDDGTTAFSHPLPTLPDAKKLQEKMRMSYPWPEEIRLGRRLKAGPWEPVADD